MRKSEISLKPNNFWIG